MNATDVKQKYHNQMLRWGYFSGVWEMGLWMRLYENLIDGLAGEIHEQCPGGYEKDTDAMRDGDLLGK